MKEQMRENSSIHLSLSILDSIADKSLNLEKYPDIKVHIDSCESCANYIMRAEARAKSFKRNIPRPGNIDNTLRKTSAILTNKRSLRDNFNKLFQYLLCPKPVLLISLVIVFLTAGIIFYQSPFLKGDMGIENTNSFIVWINNKQIENKEKPIPCKENDSLQFSIISPKPLNYYILYQDDGGQIQIYFPENLEQAIKAGNTKGELLPQKIILHKNWKKKTIYCILTYKELSFVEAITIVNRYLRKELPGDRPLIETFYLVNTG